MMSQKGISLVELLVGLVVVLVVLAGASTAYLKLVKGFKTQSRISGSYMENLCGVELLRYDIEMAGYGLPAIDPATCCTYSEAASAVGVVPNPSSFNDAANNVNGPFSFSNNGSTSANNSDVLVIRSLAASLNEASRKWSTLYHDGTNWLVKPWGNSELDFANNDRIIVVDEEGAILPFTSSFFVKRSEIFTTSDKTPTGLNTQKVYIVYGIDPDTDLRMPFNRVEYYLKQPPTRPSRCYPNSFTLYRATINQSNGARNEEPLMDCVEDFQVAFGIDTDGDGIRDSWVRTLSGLDGNGNGTDNEIRSQLKEVRINVLYHEGQKDTDFQFTGSINLGDPEVAGDPAFTDLSSSANTNALSSFSPSSAGSDAIHYRWKTLKLAVKPMNL